MYPLIFIIHLCRLKYGTTHDSSAMLSSKHLASNKILRIERATHFVEINVLYNSNLGSG